MDQNAGRSTVDQQPGRRCARRSEAQGRLQGSISHRGSAPEVEGADGDLTTATDGDRVMQFWPATSEERWRWLKLDNEATQALLSGAR
jgi:hypothetical protein